MGSRRKRRGIFATACGLPARAPCHSRSSTLRAKALRLARDRCRTLALKTRGVARAHPRTMEDFAAMYIGPERRARRVYVTRNHEYHCKSGVCVAVRDVLSGAFVDDHEALGRVAGGVIHPYRDGVGRSIGSIQTATPGTRVHFSFDADDSCSVLTSAIESIERPPPEVVALYDRP